MSTLISSAVSGNKAAPKAPPRRRAAPPAPSQTPAKAATSVTSVRASSGAPPHVQSPTTTARQVVLSSPNDAIPHDRDGVPESIPLAGATAAERTTEQAHQAAVDPRQSLDEVSTTTTEQESSAQDEGLPNLRTQQTARKRQRGPGLPPNDVQPAKRAKRSPARSNAPVRRTIGEEEAPPSTEVGARPDMSKRRAPNKRRAGTLVRGKDTSMRKDRARNAMGQPATDVAVDPNLDDREVDGHEDEDEPESDPELHEIDPNTVQMYQLARDTRYGKVSEREKKMAEIDWAEVARKRREAIQKAMSSDPQRASAEAEVVPTTEGPSGTAEPDTVPAPAPGITFRIVNGQIVEDESTLTIDRRALAEAEALDINSNEPIEEANDLTMRINRSTYLNERRRDAVERQPMWRIKSDPWSDEETDRFYDALKMFGTDFFIISKMFAPRNRKSIKHKFVREEKLDPIRINNALLGKDTSRPAMNLEFYARESGREVQDFTKYESYDHAQREIEAGLGDKRVAMEAAIAEEEEVEKAKAAAAEMRKKGRKEGGQTTAAAGKGRKKKTGTLGDGGGEDVDVATAGAEAAVMVVS